MKKALLLAALSLLACAHPQRRPADPVTVAFEIPIRTGFVGEGSLEARSERTGKTRLALERLSVRAETTGDVAEVAVEHVFRNDSEERLEGTFRFPLPEGSML